MRHLIALGFAGVILLFTTMAASAQSFHSHGFYQGLDKPRASSPKSLTQPSPKLIEAPRLLWRFTDGVIVNPATGEPTTNTSNAKIRQYNVHSQSPHARRMLGQRLRAGVGGAKLGAFGVMLGLLPMAVDAYQREMYCLDRHGCI